MHTELWDSIKALETKNVRLEGRLSAAEQNIRNLVLLADELRRRIADMEQERVTTRRSREYTERRRE